MERAASGWWRSGRKARGEGKKGGREGKKRLGNHLHRLFSAGFGDREAAIGDLARTEDLGPTGRGRRGRKEGKKRRNMVCTRLISVYTLLSDPPVRRFSGGLKRHHQGGVRKEEGERGIKGEERGGR